jgi:tryptophan-rich sensory protein
MFIAIAGWQIYHLGDPSLRALWALQLILNGLWSWVFFGQHWVSAALVNIVLLDIVVINLILKAGRAGLRIPSLLLTPYIIWLLLATSLNTYIVLAN